MDSWTPERVHKAFQAVLQRESVYSGMLPFFESVYMLQEASVAAARPEPLPAVIDAAIDRERSLLAPSQFTIDWSNALQLLGRLCEQAPQSNAEMAAGASSIAGRLDAPETNFQLAFSYLIEGRSEDFSGAAAELEAGPDVLGFLLFNSAWPSIAHHSRALAAKYVQPDSWDKGTCPICNSAPFISLLDETGRRELVCAFCRHQWHAKRIFCPFCGEEDSRALSYFFSEDEKAYRVHTCQSCLKYLKNVDTRELNRLSYPPLEAILTTHLDLTAQQLGFKSMTPVWLSL